MESYTRVTVMDDGRFDIRHGSLINILIDNFYGTIFLKYVEASFKVKDTEYFFGLFDGVIEEIGEYLIMHVAIDDDCRIVGSKLMKRENICIEHLCSPLHKLGRKLA